MQERLQRFSAYGLGGLSAFLLAGLVVAGPAMAEDPIKIGFDLSQTGPLAPNGKQALLGAKIWEEEVNAKGGLLGRKVNLIGYDDQSNPSNVPGIYAKLLDVDKVDLIMGPYGTNLVAPAIPVAMQKGKVMIGLFALEVNSHFHYPKYFSMVPYGPDPKVSSAEGFFDVAAAQNPKPQTVAIISEDCEFGHNGADSAVINAKKKGMKVVYNKSFPPGTTDFAPVIRAVAASNPDIVVVCSYPLSSVGIVQSVNELGFKPKMIGGEMVGLQATVFKDRLKSKLNGFINYETWVPSPKMMPRAQAFFTKYQERAKAARRRSARLLSRRLGLRRLPGARRGRRGRKKPGRFQDRRLAAPQRGSHRHRRHQLRPGRRVDQARTLSGSIPRHHRCREPRNLAGHELSDRGVSSGPENRRRDLSIRKGQIAALSPLAEKNAVTA